MLYKLYKLYNIPTKTLHPTSNKKTLSIKKTPVKAVI